MDRKKIGFVVGFLIITVVFQSAAFAQEARESGKAPGPQRPSVGIKVVDLLLVRPIAIAVASISTAFCVATLPFTFPAGVSEPSARILVEAPWRYAGGRYLGEFDRY
ncbi:MAG: hypothetical protein EHM36_08010, partial [Deltaproteobacteria bacterium]